MALSNLNFNWYHPNLQFHNYWTTFKTNIKVSIPFAIWENRLQLKVYQMWIPFLLAYTIHRKVFLSQFHKIITKIYLWLKKINFLISWICWHKFSHLKVLIRFLHKMKNSHQKNRLNLLCLHQKVKTYASLNKSSRIRWL